ncbi:AAA family ATPase [Pseudomonadota bacterium]
MELTKISVESFKKIEALEVDVEPLNLVIGGNNSGKSSLLQAIHTAVSAAQSQIEQGGLKAFAEEALRYSPSSDFATLGHRTPFGNRWDQNRAKINFTSTDIVDDEATELQYKVELYKGRNPKVVGVERSGNQRLGFLVSHVTNPYSIYVPGLAGIPHFEEYKSAPVVLRKLAGGEANLVLRNIIWQIKEEGKLARLIEDLDEFFPGIHIRTDYESQKHTNIAIEVRPSARDNYYSIELCGTGILQTIQIFAYVILFQPTLLLLDEPDAHLHPSNQVKLIEAISFLHLMYGTKTIIATHSRHLMTAAHSDAKFYWLENGRKKEDEQFELAKALMDIGGLDDADKLVNSNKEFLFFTEDKKKKPIRNLLSCCGVREDRYDVIAYHGVSNAEATAKIISSLQPFIRGDTQIIIHRDRDFMDDRELSGFRHAFESNGLKVFITQGSDTESYFINAEHIAYGTDLTTNDVEALIEECLIENDEIINKRFKNKRREINGMPVNRDGDATPTSVLLPEDEYVELHHAVGKDFCSMLRRMAQERGIRNLNPEKISNVCLAPDLVRILEE